MHQCVEVPLIIMMNLCRLLFVQEVRPFYFNLKTSFMRQKTFWALCVAKPWRWSSIRTFSGIDRLRSSRSTITWPEIEAAVKISSEISVDGNVWLNNFLQVFACTRSFFLFAPTSAPTWPAKTWPGKPMPRALINILTLFCGISDLNTDMHVDLQSTVCTWPFESRFLCLSDMTALLSTACLPGIMAARCTIRYQQKLRILPPLLVKCIFAQGPLCTFSNKSSDFLLVLPEMRNWPRNFPHRNKSPDISFFKSLRALAGLVPWARALDEATRRQNNITKGRSILSQRPAWKGRGEK